MTSRIDDGPRVLVVEDDAATGNALTAALGEARKIVLCWCPEFLGETQTNSLASVFGQWAG